MRSHVLLRLVGEKELWKSMRAASSLCLETMILIIDTFTCVFARLEFTYCVSTMGNLIALGFTLWNLEMWLCWNDEGDWWRGVLFFHFRVSPGYRQSIAGNTWVVLPCLALSCLVLSCPCCCYCCWFCCSCCCCCCCLPSHYRAACATRGTRNSRHWPGDRGGNSPACLRPTANTRLVRHECRAMR